MAKTEQQAQTVRRYTRRMTLADFSDYALLHIVDDHSGQQVIEIAQSMERETRSVSARLVWLKRNGYVTRDTKGGWVLARRGRTTLEGRGDLVAQARELSAAVARDRTAGWILNREYKRGLL